MLVQTNHYGASGAAAYPESVSILATGCSSSLASWRSRLRSQSSRHVLFEKSTSTAPARVPVAINGDAAPGDQAKVAVLGISRRRTMLAGKDDCGGKFETKTNQGSNISNDCKSHPCTELTTGGVMLDLAAVNQVASWTWRDRGTRAKPFWALAKTPRGLSHVISSSLSRACNQSWGSREQPAP